MEEEKKVIEIGWDTRIKTNPDFILREIGGESILVPVGEAGPFENAMLTLNDTSAFMWKMFMEGCTIGDVRDKALEEYTSDVEGNKDILNGIMAYVIQSLQLGLLKTEEDEG